VYNLARKIYYKFQDFPILGAFLRSALKIRWSRFQKKFNKSREIETFIERRIDEFLLAQSQAIYKKREFKWPPDGE
jgi:hypothetical protein